MRGLMGPDCSLVAQVRAGFGLVAQVRAGLGR